jgi:outer membrane protein
MLDVRRHGPSILFLSIFLAFAYAGHAESANVKLGVVDVERVLRVSKVGRAESSSVEREKKRLQSAIRKKEDELRILANKVRDLQVEIEQKSAIWRQEEKERKAFDLRSQRRELVREQDNFRRLVRESERDLRERGRIARNKLLKEVRVIIEEIAKNEKFDIVLNFGFVLFVNPRVDLTERVIKLYDQKKK